MININPEIIRFVINTAREFQTECDNVTQDDQVNPLEEEFDISSNSSTEHTVNVFDVVINDLEPDQQQCIVALMWLGRGDFSIDEWPDAINEARDHWSNHTASYLISTPMVADYLAEGLAMHGYTQD